MTQLLDDLRAIHTLLSDESRWTKGAHARGANNRVTQPWFPSAKKFDLVGAIYHLRVDSKRFEAVHTELQKALWSRGIGHSLSHYNDTPTTTHADILTLITTAITNVESSQ